MRFAYNVCRQSGTDITKLDKFPHGFPSTMKSLNDFYKNDKNYNNRLLLRGNQIVTQNATTADRNVSLCGEQVMKYPVLEASTTSGAIGLIQLDAMSDRNSGYSSCVC
jgi:arginase family enzyme